MDGESCVLRCSLTSAPTYLNEFYIVNEILLVNTKKTSVSNCDDSQQDVLEKPKDLHKSESSLDLTGNPLEVDLNEDNSFGICVKSFQTNHFTDEEAKFIPLPLLNARKFIFKHNTIKKLEEERSKPVYCVCDCNDSLQTLIIGAQTDILMTCLINFIGYYPRDHKILSMESMVTDHIRNTREKEPLIEYLTRFKYFIYGTFIHNSYDLTNSENYGSIVVEVKSNKCIASPQTVSDIKMIFKVFLGHSLSPVNFLWEELCLLQNFLDILVDSERYNNEETILAKKPISEAQINNKITQLISSNLQKREVIKKFDLDNIRQEHLLDKLWGILKYCENLSVLRDTLNYFFEELVETYCNVKVPKNDKSTIAAIVTGLIDGKLAIPRLTFQQALLHLLELGTEKLKHDYDAIITNFYSSFEQSLETKWSKLHAEEIAPQDGRSYRKSRLTVNLKLGKNDTSLKTTVAKLAYLGNLHVAVDFIYLVKNEAHLPDEIFDNFCQRVYKKYVDKDVQNDEFADLLHSRLCSFEFNLSSVDTKFINTEKPYTFSMRMKSKVNTLEITTMYHLSKYPIFPALKNNKLPDEKEDVGINLFVTKMIEYQEVHQS